MRAKRRHDRERLMRNRRYYWGRDLSAEPKMLARCADTPKPHCNCSMCRLVRSKRDVSIRDQREMQRGADE